MSHSYSLDPEATRGSLKAATKDNADTPAVIDRSLEDDLAIILNEYAAHTVIGDRYTAEDVGKRDSDKRNPDPKKNDQDNYDDFLRNLRIRLGLIKESTLTGKEYGEYRELLASSFLWGKDKKRLEFLKEKIATHNGPLSLSENDTYQQLKKEGSKLDSNDRIRLESLEQRYKKHGVNYLPPDVFKKVNELLSELRVVTYTSNRTYAKAVPVTEAEEERCGQRKKEIVAELRILLDPKKQVPNLESKATQTDKTQRSPPAWCKNQPENTITLKF